MKEFITFVLAFALVIIIGSGLAIANDDNPPTDRHYNLNIIGFDQCKKKIDDTNPDCFKGNAGDIENNDATIFVPIETNWLEDPCESDAKDYYADPQYIQTAKLKKGVRILVSDGDDMMVVDRDATDGTAKFILPDGEYEVWARPLGKPNGCLDIDTIICSIWDGVTWVPTDCDPALPEANWKYSLVGHLDVNRTKEGSDKPLWENATTQLLNDSTGVNSGVAGYFDFFWQIFNNNLRLLQLRFSYLGPAGSEY